ncbi:MAG: NAD(P)-dependent oxidoreductase [candidate division WOR-3 bacterium]
MRILITGSTGFVGRYLVKLLENNNYQIHRIVRAKKGYPNEHIWDFSGNIPSYIPECEIIVHLAAYVDFGTSFNYEQYLVNTISTLRLLDYAKKYGSYLIFSSMAGVHGSKYEIVNEHTPISPENNYALSKYIAEEIIRIYHDNYTILRIGGIYGIDGPYHLGLNTAIKNAVYYKKPPTNNFCYKLYMYGFYPDKLLAEKDNSISPGRYSPLGSLLPLCLNHDRLVGLCSPCHHGGLVGSAPSLL